MVANERPDRASACLTLYFQPLNMDHLDVKTPPDLQLDQKNGPILYSPPSLAFTLLTLTLRVGRMTRLLPRVRGFYKLRDFYQRHLPQGFLARIKFDGDLVLDLDLRDNLGLFLWHYPS